MPQQMVYVEGRGLVPADQAKSTTTTTNQSSPGQQLREAMPGPMRAGLDAMEVFTGVNPLAEPKTSADASRALPDLAGLLTSIFMPQSARFPARMALQAGVPAATELVRQRFAGEDADGTGALTTGLVNMLPGFLTEGGKLLARGGRKMVGEAITSGGSRLLKGTLDLEGNPIGGNAPALNLATLKRLAETIMREGASLTEAGEKHLVARYGDLLKTANKLKPGAQLDALTQRLDAIEEVIPWIRQTVTKSATQSAGIPRMLAGAGIGTLLGPALMAMGVDPKVAMGTGLAIGTPIGISQASPNAKAKIGSSLVTSEKVAPWLERLLRGVMIEESATEQRPVR